MSATYEVAQTAASYVDDVDLCVIDTATAAGAQGLVVMAAAELAATGASLAEVAFRARRVARDVHLMATLRSLDSLSRSGRVPQAAAWAGRTMGVQIMFEFSGGRARPRRPARTERGALERMVGAMLRSRPPGAEDPDRRVVLRGAVLEAQAKDSAAALRQLVLGAVPEAESSKHLSARSWWPTPGRTLSVWHGGGSSSTMTPVRRTVVNVAGVAERANVPMTTQLARVRDEDRPDDGSAAGKRAPKQPVKRVWVWIRRVVLCALFGVAVWFLAQKGSELRGAVHLLARANWSWVAVAVLFEAASMVVFARMQRWLLLAGHVKLPLRTMVEITLAGNAISTTLPGGVAWAAAWAFGQLRRRGVDRFLRVWVFLVAGAVSSFALFILVAIGIEVAGGRGPVAGLRWAAARSRRNTGLGFRGGACATTGAGEIHRNATGRLCGRTRSGW